MNMHVADTPRGPDRVHQLTNYLESIPPGKNPTAYDTKLMSTYLLLLEAESEGVVTADMTVYFVEAEYPREPGRLLHLVERHLARAHELVASGHLVAW